MWLWSTLRQVGVKAGKTARSIKLQHTENTISFLHLADSLKALVVSHCGASYYTLILKVGSSHLGCCTLPHWCHFVDYVEYVFCDNIGGQESWTCHFLQLCWDELGSPHKYPEKYLNFMVWFLSNLGRFVSKPFLLKIHVGSPGVACAVISEIFTQIAI